MDTTQLKEILDKHKEWVLGGDGGQRADLQRADLQGAYLRGADLQGADLRGAYLQGADLRGAYLRDTIMSNINWLTYIGISTLPDGTAYAYKVINATGDGIYQGGINYLNGTEFEVPEIETDVNRHCAKGINLATFQWCLFEKKSKDNRLLLMKFKVSDAVCPVASDGKFRVKKCTKVGEVDWNGNLITTKKGV